MTNGFIDRGEGRYTVPALVSPTTGKYITADHPTEPEAGFDAYYVEWMAKAQDEDDQYAADKESK